MARKQHSNSTKPSDQATSATTEKEAGTSPRSSGRQDRRPKTRSGSGITLADLLTKNQDLTYAAANISWDFPANRAFVTQRGIIEETNRGGKLHRFEVGGGEYINGGICNIRWMPTFGTSVNPYSPLNITGRAMDSFIRAQNSRSRTYDYTDLLTHIIAADSLFLFFIHMRRIYRVVRMYDMLDYGQPELILRSLGVNGTDMRSHLMDLWGYMSEFATRLSTVALPGTMSVVATHQFLTDNIFKDVDAAQKAEFYVFCPSGFWQFTENEAISQSKLKYHAWYSGVLRTFENIRAFGDELWQRFTLSEDIAVMNADILHAYGPGVMALATMPSPDEVLLPVYNPDVCDMVQNMAWYGKVYAKTSPSQTIADTNRPKFVEVIDSELQPYLEFLPCVHTLNNSPSTERRYSFSGDDFSPKQIMLASFLNSGSVSAPRLFAKDSIDNDVLEYQLDDCSVVLPEEVVLLYATSTNAQTVDATFQNGSEVMVNTDAATALINYASVSKALSVFSEFKRHPEISVTLYSYDTGSTEQSTCRTTGKVYFSEIRNFTFVDVAQQHKLHRAALISLMNTGEASKGV